MTADDLMAAVARVENGHAVDGGLWSVIDAFHRRASPLAFRHVVLANLDRIVVALKMDLSGRERP